MSIRRLLRGGERVGDVWVAASAYVDFGGCGGEGMGDMWQPHVHFEGLTITFRFDWLLSWSDLGVAFDVFCVRDAVVVPAEDSNRVNSCFCLGLGSELSSIEVGGECSCPTSTPLDSRLFHCER